MMSGRLDLGGGEPENPLSFFVVGTAANHDARSGRTTNAYDYDSFGMAAGAEYDFGAGMLGLALAYSKPETDALDRQARTRGDVYQIGAYGKFEAGGAFAEGYAGAGRLDYRMRRAAVIDDIFAESDGTTMTAGAEAGYLFPLSGLQAGPIAGVQYARVKLDGYTERGDEVLTLNVAERRASELVGFTGVEVGFEDDIGGLSVKPFVKLAAEKLLDGSGGGVRFAGTASPGIVNRFVQEESSRDVYGRVEGGASLALGTRAALQFQASATVEHPEHDEFTGFFGLKLGF
jgi:outer membrane autotransporter protein